MSAPIGPLFDSGELTIAVADMGRALHALRLEVPAAVADDLMTRWRLLLDAIDVAVGDG